MNLHLSMTTGLNLRKRNKISFEAKDFSMHLSHELIKLFGEPYQSSIRTVRRFARGNLRVYVQYEREMDTVNFVGLVPIGLLALGIEDAFDFIGEVEENCELLNTFTIDKTGDILNIIPEINISFLLKGVPSDKRIPQIIEIINEIFSHLEKIEKTMAKYGKKAVGFKEINQIWEEAKKTDDSNKKGKLLEELFCHLIRIDGNLVLVERNLRTKSEEIDIVLQTGVSSPFWSRVASPLILMECKNWKDKVGVKEVRDFVGKIENRPRLICQVGFLIALSGFTKAVEEELVGYRGRDFLLATITGSDIESLLKSKTLISNLLRKKLVAAGFR